MMKMLNNFPLGFLMKGEGDSIDSGTVISSSAVPLVVVEGMMSCFYFSIPMRKFSYYPYCMFHEASFGMAVILTSCTV
jgi:hypothetical protein